MKQGEQLSIPAVSIKESQKAFGVKVKSAMNMLGIVLTLLGAVMYIILTVVMYTGMGEGTKTASIFYYSLISAFIGVSISLSLCLQGRIYGKENPEYSELIKKFYSTKTKATKPMSERSFWVRTLLINILTKGSTFAISTLTIAFMAIEGINNPMIFLYCLSNLVMFLGFGFLGFNGAFISVEKGFIPYIKECLAEVEQQSETLDERALQLLNFIKEPLSDEALQIIKIMEAKNER